MHTAPMSQSGAPPSAQGLVDNPPVGRKGILSRAVGCHEHPLRHSNSVEQGQETGCVEVTRGRPCPPTHASTLSSGVLQDGSSRVLSLFEGRLDWMAGAAGRRAARGLVVGALQTHGMAAGPGPGGTFTASTLAPTISLPYPGMRGVGEEGIPSTDTM